MAVFICAAAVKHDLVHVRAAVQPTASRVLAAAPILPMARGCANELARLDVALGSRISGNHLRLHSIEIDAEGI